MTNRTSRVPQYRFLYETLRQQIIRGDFGAGDLLPSEKELQTHYHLTQPTIRQALGLLVQDGYIRKHQGKGSIVLPLPIGLGVMSIVGRLANSTVERRTVERRTVERRTVERRTVERRTVERRAVERRAERITTTILAKPRLGEFPADMLFTPTEEDGKEGFYYLERLRSVDEEPVFFEKLILPNRYLTGFGRQGLANRSLFDLLRSKYGLEVKGGEQKVLAVTAEEALAAHLGVPVGAPLLRLDKRIDTNRIDFSFYSSLYARTDHFLLHGRF